MGLDIIAYCKLQKMHDVVFDASGEPINPETREELDSYARFYVNEEFPGRNGSIESGAVYMYEDRFGFKAGSYGGYNTWREQLATLAGYPAVEYVRDTGYDAPREILHAAAAWKGLCDGCPFVELVDFSDCEGVIGTEISSKLAKDFADFDDSARMTGDDYFYKKYSEWRKAFEMASDGGAVRFT